MASLGKEEDAVLIDNEEIIASLNEISGGNLLISIQELKNIQSGKVIEIYKVFLSALFPGVQEELSMIPTSDFVLGAKHSFLFEDSVGLIGLAIPLSKVFQECGVDNFSIRDLVAPKPKKTQRLLSSLLNYIRFCSREEENVVDEAYYHFNQHKQGYEEDVKTKCEITKRVEEYELKRAEQQKEFRKLKPDADALEERRNKLMLALNEADYVFNEDNQRVSIKEIKLETAQTRSKYVDATARESEIKSLQYRLSCKLSLLRNLEEDCNTGLKLLLSISNGLEKHLKVRQSLENLQERTRVQEQHLTDLLAKIQIGIRQENIIVERLSRVQSQHQHSKSDKLEKIEAEERITSALRSEVEGKTRQELTEMEAAAAELSQIISYENSEFEEKKRAVSDMYGRLLDQLDTYHETLTLGFGKIMAKVPI